MKDSRKRRRSWWKTDDFFGQFYYEGDHSLEGYISGRPLTVRQRTLREVNGIERLLNLRERKGTIRLLDAPCGYGRHLIEMKRRNYDVTGLDYRTMYCEMVRNDLKGHNLTAEVYCGEIKDLPFSDASFDLVLNMFFSFGFYDDDVDNRRCLAEFWRVLRPGGRFLLHTDVTVPAIDNGSYKLQERRTLESGRRLDIFERFDRQGMRINGTWTIQHADRQRHLSSRSANYSMRVYRPG